MYSFKRYAANIIRRMEHTVHIRYIDSNWTMCESQKKALFFVLKDTRKKKCVAAHETGYSVEKDKEMGFCSCLLLLKGKKLETQA